MLALGLLLNLLQAYTATKKKKKKINSLAADL